MPMDPQSLAVFVVPLVVVAVLFLLLGRRLGAIGAAEASNLRAAKADLEQRLAVAISKAERWPELEAGLRDLAAAHVVLQRQHAEEATLVVERTRERDQAIDLLRDT